MEALHQPTSTVVIGKTELVRAIGEIRELADAYGQLVSRPADSEEWSNEVLELMRAHHAALQEGTSPLDKLDLLAGLFRYLSGRLEQDAFRFRIRSRVGLVPEAGGEGWAEYSDLLKEFHHAAEVLVARVERLAEIEALHDQPAQREVLRALAALFKSLLRQDWNDAELLIGWIHRATESTHDQDLLGQIARIARTIYNSLNEFSELMSVETLSASTDELPDAVVKLESVIARLEDAANTNLEALERLSIQLGETSKWVRTSREVVADCDGALEAMIADHSDMAEALSEIRTVLREEVGADLAELESRVASNGETFMAMTANQSFQDLTGQTLKKVIRFVEDLQFKLLKLLPNYQPVKEPMTQAEQEAAPATAPQGPIKSQETVDQMLADLGF